MSPLRIVISKKAGGNIPSGLANGDDGHPRAWLIWDFMKIAFRTVKDGHRKICTI